MKKTFTLAVTIFILSAILSFNSSNSNKAGIQTRTNILTLKQSDNLISDVSKSNPYTKIMILNLRERKKDETVALKSYAAEPFEEIIEVYPNSNHKPQFLLEGSLRLAYQTDLENDGAEELAIEVVTGKLGNTIVYRVEGNQLVPIRIQTGKQEDLLGVTSYHTPRFEDIDRDGVLEMLSYHTDSAFDENGWLEVYKFDGQKFLKVKEYEESTANFYL